MSEKPILFNTEMVRAILEGRKTQTRRIIRPQPEARLCYAFAGSNGMPGTWGYPTRDVWERWGNEYRLPMFLREPDRRWTPPYRADDMLWVRETWNYGFVESSDREYTNDVWFEPSDWKTEGSYIRALSQWWYKADANNEKDMHELNGFWRPSIHMPKAAARIWLRVTTVRCEQLNDMTEEDAIAEGFPDSPAGTDSPLERFSELWDKTIKRVDRDRFGLYGNPWVWVIEFAKPAVKLLNGEVE